VDSSSYAVDYCTFQHNSKSKMKRSSSEV